MRKLIFIIFVLLLTQACGSDFPGSKTPEKMDTPKFTVTEYDFDTNCFTLEWEPVYTASKYRVTRKWSRRTDTVRVETEITGTSFKNCYDDPGDWAFDYTYDYLNQNTLSYKIEGYVDGSGGIGKLWGAGADYRSPTISHIKMLSEEYTSYNNCVKLHWSDIPSVYTYIIERTCAGSCTGVAPKVTIESYSTYFDNCANDDGYMAFNPTQGDVLTYTVKAFIGRNEMLQWGGEAKHSTLPLN